MRVNDYGYTLDYEHQCAAWKINNMGPARKQCSLGVVHSIDDWIYLCPRHYKLIFKEFEERIDNLNSRRVENMQERLDAVAEHERRMIQDAREVHLMMEEHEQQIREQTVYFIRCQEFMKIGISMNPATRLKQIRKGGGSHFPRRLDVETAELIVTEPGGLVREKELHAKFAHLRHTGEWFTEAPELTEYIESLTEEQAA